jgi:pyruvate dehydrogenase E1 component
VAATDYLKLLPDMVARFVDRPLLPLGTDGFGLSDTRPAARRYFEVDAEHVAAAGLYQLAKLGQLEASRVAQALGELGLDPDAPDPARR